jgi:hypothetical protein
MQVNMGRGKIAIWQDFACLDCCGSGHAYCCETAGSNQPNAWPSTEPAVCTSCWPIQGSEGLYDPIDIRTKGSD